MSGVLKIRSPPANAQWAAVAVSGYPVIATPTIVNETGSPGTHVLGNAAVSLEQIQLEDALDQALEAHGYRLPFIKAISSPIHIK
jgi:hypothetical protein